MAQPSTPGQSPYDKFNAVGLAESRELAIAVAHAMSDKKAENIVVLEVSKLIGITHHFVVCTGRNRRQVQAIADEIEVRCRGLGHKPYGVEGYRQASWVLLDFQDVIAHVFVKEMRDHYDLELHWGDAPRIDAGLPALAAAPEGEDGFEPDEAYDSGEWRTDDESE